MGNCKNKKYSKVLGKADLVSLLFRYLYGVYKLNTSETSLQNSFLAPHFLLPNTHSLHSNLRLSFAQPPTTPGASHLLNTSPSQHLLIQQILGSQWLLQMSLRVKTISVSTSPSSTLKATLAASNQVPLLTTRAPSTPSLILRMARSMLTSSPTSHPTMKGLEGSRSCQWSNKMLPRSHGGNSGPSQPKAQVVTRVSRSQTT